MPAGDCNTEDKAWAQAYLERLGNTAKSAGGAPDLEDSGYTGEGWSDEALGQVFWEVIENAEEVMSMETAVLADFISFPRGSDSTKKKKGIEFDVMRGEAQSDEARMMCERLAIPKSRSCDIRLHGTDLFNATMLVKEWCRRAQWSLEEERVKSSGCAPTPYVVPDEFQHWYDKLPAKSEARRSADSLVRQWALFV